MSNNDESWIGGVVVPLVLFVLFLTWPFWLGALAYFLGGD